jgi:hypothetical protein
MYPFWNIWNWRHIFIFVGTSFVSTSITRTLCKRIDLQFDQHQGLGCGLMGFDCVKHLLPNVTHPHNETRRQRMIGNGEPLLLHGPHLRCKHAVSKSRHKWLCPFYSVMMFFFTETCSSPTFIMQHEVRYSFTQLECSVPENVTWNGGELIHPLCYPLS